MTTIGINFIETVWPTASTTSLGKGVTRMSHTLPCLGLFILGYEYAYRLYS